MFISMIFVVILIYFIYEQRYRRRRKQLETFNGPKYYPIIGSMHMFLKPTREVFRVLKDFSQNYQSPVTVWLVNIPFAYFYDAESFKIIFNKVLLKGEFFGFLRQLFGNGLITVDNVEKWKSHRRLLNPIFDMKERGSVYLKLMNQQRRLIDDFEKVCDTEKPINSWNSVFYHEYEKVFQSLMDFHPKIKFDAITYKFSKQMKEAILFTIKRVILPWLHFDTLNNIYNYITGNNVILENLDDFSVKILDEKRLKNLSNKNEEVPDHEKLFIDYLLDWEIRQFYTEQELKDEIKTFLDAASTTTCTAVCFTLDMLAIHPEEQQTVYEEVTRVLGDDDEVVDIEKCNELKFLEQCVNETLRLFPPVPHLLRKNQEDLIMKDKGVIPEGTTCVMSIYFLHRNPRIYDEPDKWKPDRFHQSEILKRPSHSFCPFGAGPRLCLGYKYAMISMKSVLAKVIKRYRFTTDLTLQNLNDNLDFDMLLRSKVKHLIYVHSR